MQVLQILGAKRGKFQFSLTKPYKECACHQNASFKPLTAIIGPTDGPVAMSMKPKKPKKERKNRRLTMTISRMHRHAPFEPTDPNFCLWGGVTDIINCAKFVENRFRGSGAGRPGKMAFPIESVHRPYNSAALHIKNAHVTRTRHLSH